MAGKYERLGTHQKSMASKYEIFRTHQKWWLASMKDLRKLHCREVGWITQLVNCWNTVVLKRNKTQVFSNCCRNGQSSIQPIARKVPVKCVSKCQKFLTFTKQIGTIKSYLEAQMNGHQEEGTQLRSSTWRSCWSVHTSETPNTHKVLKKKRNPKQSSQNKHLLFFLTHSYLCDDVGDMSIATNPINLHIKIGKRARK